MGKKTIVGFFTLLISTIFFGMLTSQPVGSAEPSAIMAWSDETASAGLTFATSDQQQTGSGMVSADFNNDGHADLFVLGDKTIADALFINQGDGTFQNQAAAWGVNATHRGSGAAAGDINHDGWIDIYVTSLGTAAADAVGNHKLYKNNGNGTFTDIASLAGVQSTNTVSADGFGAVFGDYDLDGDLDLFVAGQTGSSGNFLFKNNGDETFSNATVAADLNLANVEGFTPCLIDMNGDRWPELILTGNNGTSRYFANDRDGTFTDKTVETMVNGASYAKGAAYGDFNGDTWFEWFITSVYDSTGTDPDATGDVFNVNRSEFTYSDESSSSLTSDGSFGWGAIAADFNNDTRLDIAQTNGWETGQHANQPAKLWLNNGDLTFTDVATSTGFIHSDNGRGIIAFDYDSDGDQDAVISTQEGGLTLYRNDLSGSDTNWLNVKLDTSANPNLPPNGFGSMVYFQTDNKNRLVKQVNGCSSFLSQSDSTLHFGLKDDALVEAIRVEWADGTVTWQENVAVNQTITIAAPSPQTPNGTQLNFTNVTDAAGVTGEHKSDLAMYPFTVMMGGAAAGDFNKDGWVDVFVTSGGFEPDKLYINNQDGTFSDEAASWGVDHTHVGAGPSLGDYNNDGWLDIFIMSLGDTAAASTGKHLLYKNNGDGTFSEVAVSAGVNYSGPQLVDSFGSTFGDFDLDGDLDLFVTGWQKENDPTPTLGNRLFENNGDGTFQDVTNTTGAYVSDLRGFSPCFVDTNDDRYPELLVAADFGTSTYFTNNQNGTLSDTTIPASVTDYAYGMGSAVSDFNNDGQLDWYITSIYDIATENLPSSAEGNRLYINNGPHSFVESASSAAVDTGEWGWGSVAVDLDHDGWVDLAETNGWWYEPHTYRPAKVWLNNGDLTFDEVATETGLGYDYEGRGLLNFDYDNDGDQDLLFTSNNGPLELYRNDLPANAGNWLRIVLDSSTNAQLAPNGYGSKVTVTVAGQEYVRSMNGCSNYISQSEQAIHFGLGNVATVDEIQIEWANGLTSVYTNVATDQQLTYQAPAIPAAVEFQSIGTAQNNTSILTISLMLLGLTSLFVIWVGVKQRKPA